MQQHLQNYNSVKCTESTNITTRGALGQSDENHCAPRQPTFRIDKLLFFKDKQQLLSQLLGQHENGKACKSTEKCNGFTPQHKEIEL